MIVGEEALLPKPTTTPQEGEKRREGYFRSMWEHQLTVTGTREEIFPFLNPREYCCEETHAGESKRLAPLSLFREQSNSSASGCVNLRGRE